MSSENTAELRKKGMDSLYKQCDSSLYEEAIGWIDEAARAGDADAWYVLGHCFSWGDGGVGFNKEKAYDCFLRGARGGSALAVLGALRAGLFDDTMRRESLYTVRECWNRVRSEADMGDEYAAWQVAETLEWGDLSRLTEEELNVLLPREEEPEDGGETGKAEAGDIGESSESAGGQGNAEPDGEEAARNTDGTEFRKAADESAEENAEDHLDESAEENAEDHLDEGAEGNTADHLDESAGKNSADGADGKAAETAADSAAAEKDTGLRIRRVITKPFPRFMIPEPRISMVYYSKAAETGIVAAMEKIGKHCREGRLIPVDIEGFLLWARKCASLGNAWGLCEMGLYSQEKGDDEAAFRYLEAAEIQGDPRAFYPLGMYYLEGKVTERDLDKAVSCLEKAGKMNDNRSFMALGNLFYQDILVERDDGKAFYWYSKAYGDGYGEAALALAHLYLRETEYQDNEKAVRLLEEAGAAVDPAVSSEANLMLGNIFRDGLTGIQDPVRAVYFYETGAKTGNPECMELAATMYYQGEDGLEPDYDKAFYWLNLCEQNGTLQSCSKLATLYLEGWGCEANEERAKELFEKASRTEYDGYAFYMLGKIAEQNGTPEDLEYAVRMYDTAIDMGYSEASRRLSHFRKTIFGHWKVTR